MPGQRIRSQIDTRNQYLYDADGRVCAVKNLLGQMTEYLYNAEGVRVAKGNIASWTCDTTQNNFQVTSSYILDPDNRQLTEMNWSGGTATWAHTNVYAAGELIATYTADPDQSQNVPGVLNFRLTDWLGTLRVLTNYTGNVEASCHSLPFGNGEDCTPIPPNDEHLFTGKERDSESGNDYFGARYYASSMGRFLSPDPSQLVYADPTNPQSFNLYSYALNNPLSFIDPTGLYCTYFKNDFGNPNDVESVDNNSSFGECSQTGGQWTEVSSVQVNANENDNNAGSLSVASVPTSGQIPSNPIQGQMPVQGQLPSSQTVTCVGIGRGLAGVQAPFPKKGGAFNFGKNPVQVTAGTAAVIPSQFGFTGNVAMKPFVGEIAGDVGTNHFSSVTDSVDNAVSPVPGLSTPAAFQQLNPGRLIVEITTEPDVGKNALVNIVVPRSIGCPAGTVEAK